MIKKRDIWIGKLTRRCNFAKRRDQT